MAGLADRHRSGRPPGFTPVQVAEEGAGLSAAGRDRVPLSRWSSGELAAEVMARGIAPAISRPPCAGSWPLTRSSPGSTAPGCSSAIGFATKAARVLDLDARRWDGAALSEQEYVISSDEKTSIRARCRCHPTLPPGISRTMRLEHEYDRGEALAYLAAYDVHRAQVIGLCSETTGIDPFMDLVAKS